ncbi:hypothetical protein FS749_013343 [Ceratobasidium sp. UAMH 11750]|nr:hypothetical protein FS749_013343 [Ceratobasidium sp. UAMH 11750]
MPARLYRSRELELGRFRIFSTGYDITTGRLGCLAPASCRHDVTPSVSIVGSSEPVASNKPRLSSNAFSGNRGWVEATMEPVILPLTASNLCVSPATASDPQILVTTDPVWPTRISSVTFHHFFRLDQGRIDAQQEWSGDGVCGRRMSLPRLGLGSYWSNATWPSANTGKTRRLRDASKRLVGIARCR